MMMNWKEFCRKRSWLNFKVLYRHFPGQTDENHKNLNQDSRSPGSRFEPGISGIRNGSVNHSTTTFGMKTNGNYYMQNAEHSITRGMRDTQRWNTSAA
jgi:hypothetical protein